MDLLRQLWRRIGPSDPRAKWFAIRAAVDPAPFLPRCLIPELRRIITEYAEDFAYKWRPGVPSYARVVLQGNRLISGNPASNSWFRIVASQSVRQGADRWRIISEFTASRAGCVAVGVSRSNPAYGSPKTLSERMIASEILVWTSECAGLTLDDERQVRAHIFRDDEWNPSEYSRWRAAAADGLETVVLVQCDLARRLLTITFRDGRSAIRAISVPLGNFDDWFPSVAVHGEVSATIVPWPHE
jgi:hypothetical protein